MAGHSKWANIQHRKKAQDNKRGKVFTKIIREITVAVKLAGPDISSNSRLRLAMTKANKNSVPKDTIERAIKKGSGQSDSSFEEITYEGYGPGGVAVLVEAMTDNRNRTVADVRHAFTKFGGNLGTDGSVSYLFNKIGLVIIEKYQDEDTVMETLLDFDGEDLEDTGDNFIATVPFQNLSSFVEKLKDQGIKVENAEVTMKADTAVPVDQEMGEKVLRILDFLDEVDDVQEVHSNAEFPVDFKPAE